MMRRLYRQKKLWIVLLGTTFLCLFVFGTDPRKLSAPLLLVPPITVFIILFALALTFFGAFTEVPRPKQRLMSGIIASAPVLLLLLASLGQLTGKDTLLSLLFIGGLAAYFGRFSLARSP
jgi:glucose-6-phosphate-specific signal transduction histidine kinase